MKLLTIASIFIFAAAIAAQTVTAPDIALRGPSEFTADISMTDVDDYVSSYQFVIHYDPRVIEPQGDLSNYFGCESLVSVIAVVCNVSEPGVLRVAAYSAYSFSNDGPVLRTQWTTLEGNYSPLHFSNGYVWNYYGRDMGAEFHDGSVTISSGTGICTELGC